MSFVRLVQPGVYNRKLLTWRSTLNQAPGGIDRQRVDRTYGGGQMWTSHRVSVVEANEALVGKLDVPISALLRGWILDALAAKREESIASALDRVTADIQRLREPLA